MGAPPTLYAATSPAVEPGGYYGPDGFQEMKGLPRAVPSNARSKNEADAARLWDLSEELTGVHFSVADA